MRQPTTYVVPQPNIASDVIDGETVLLPPHPGKIVVLNTLGSAVWQLASGERSVQEIIERICAEYDVAPAEAERDVLAFLGELSSRNLVSLQRAGS